MGGSVFYFLISLSSLCLVTKATEVLHISVEFAPTISFSVFAVPFLVMSLAMHLNNSSTFN
jgi:hypothetical protein